MISEFVYFRSFAEIIKYRLSITQDDSRIMRNRNPSNITQAFIANSAAALAVVERTVGVIEIHRWSAAAGFLAPTIETNSSVHSRSWVRGKTTGTSGWALLLRILAARRMQCDGSRQRSPLKAANRNGYCVFSDAQEPHAFQGKHFNQPEFQMKRSVVRSNKVPPVKAPLFWSRA